MFAYCVAAAYQEAAFRGTSQAPRCASRRAPMGAVEEGVPRGAGSGASTDVLREIGAPSQEIGVELDSLPSRSGATSSGASSAAFKTGGRPTTVSPRRIEDLARFIFNACGCRIGDQESRPMNESVATPIVANTKVARTRAAERMRRYRQRRRAGLRCYELELRESEIDALVRRDLLLASERTNRN